MSDPPADSSATASDDEPGPSADDASGTSPAKPADAETSTAAPGAPETDADAPTSANGEAETDTGTDTDEGPDDEPDSDEDPETYESTGSGMRARDVEVPMRVYKTVTVFSTLIAVVCVVGGFILLDRATDRADLPLSEVDPVVALAGIGTILFGAAIYAFATRFRARGMGRSKNDADHSSDNG